MQAHQVFSNLRWVAAGLAVVAAMGAAYSLGSGASFKGLVLPALTLLISAALAQWSSRMKGLLEFQDYRSDPLERRPPNENSSVHVARIS